MFGLSAADRSAAFHNETAVARLLGPDGINSAITRLVPDGRSRTVADSCSKNCRPRIDLGSLRGHWSVAADANAGAWAAPTAGTRGIA
jgi:hypothetical protein